MFFISGSRNRAHVSGLLIFFVKKRKQKTFKQKKIVPSINDVKNLETSSKEFLTVMLNT